MGVLTGLEPKQVFRFFEELCAIPHGSHNTKAISDYLVAFAEALPERKSCGKKETCDKEDCPHKCK